MKEIKFLLTMFWGASLTTSWMLPWWIQTSMFEINGLKWVVPIVYSIITIALGVAYTVEHWNKTWGGE